MKASIARIYWYMYILYSTGCDSAKILGVSWYPADSHQAIFQPIWKELSIRGHQVTTIAAKPLREKALTNLNEIDISFLFEKHDKAKMLKAIMADTWYFKSYVYMKYILEDIVNEMLETKSVKEFIASDEEFDVVIIEAHSLTPFVFGERFKAPVISISSCSVGLEFFDIFANPTHPLISPDLLMPVHTTPNEHPFFIRCKSFLHNIIGRIFLRWFIMPIADQTVKKHFGRHIPDLRVIIQKYSSIMLLNVNLVTNPTRANLPNIIDITQVHIRENRPLPEDLQEYLDSSTNGVVYFSLGTHVPSSCLDNETVNAIIQAFSELPYNVLWKWEYTPPRISSNVFIQDFFPQQDLLGHPNIKVFVTQGGMQSLEEAISREVPMVGIPFISDQPMNIKRLVELGMAQRIKPKEITKESLVKAILEVAQNRSYKDNVKKYKEILKDEPLSGTDKVIWWIEYVIRHKGADHLRSPAANMSFHKYYMLDVMVFFFAFVIAFLYVIYKIICFGRYIIVLKSKTKQE